MPCMFTPQSRLPLTPPDYLPPYGGCNGGIQLNSHQFAMSSQGLAMSEKGTIYDPNPMETYGRKQMPSYPHVPGQSYPVSQQQQQQQQQQGNYSGLPPPGLTHPAGRYFPVPTLSLPMPVPSGRRLELPPLEESYRHRQEPRKQEQPVHQPEEKPVGGVSAHLDYDMEEMTEFVGVMAQQLVYQRSVSDRALPQQFRKFVLQILSSTRLPSSTILLGLVYLQRRMTKPIPTASRHDHVYRMITIALLLASKFLDDNTFQNKSWSEVTGLPVNELNTLEKDWLKEIGWDLHVDPEGTKGFSQYTTMWETWVRKNGTKAAIPALAPINTNIRHHRTESTAFSPLYPPSQAYHPLSVLNDPALHLPRPQQSQPEGSYWYMNSGEYSPPSAPETGPTTPEGYAYGWPGAFAPHTRSSTYQLPALSNYHHHSHRTWPGGHPCGCSVCQRPDGYMMANFCQPVTA
ncbi:hypothetical protein B9Z19DRAFT_1006216 [Tuber borchii]|uniref:Cyclin-like protein n=1 Tax=Tuber borchii TaxID=42251 RepID=A0A2T6ZC52_TUBBO|nr:hypothetical protein B9Z19DRAFT_1006216 [Tuber borchii]